MKLKLQTVTVMQDNSKHMWVCSYSFLCFSSQLKIKLLTGKHFIGKKWHDESVSKDGQKGHSTLIIVEMLSVMNTNKYKVSQRTNKAHTETVHNERHDLTHSRLLANFDRQIPRSANDLMCVIIFILFPLFWNWISFLCFFVFFYSTDPSDKWKWCHPSVSSSSLYSVRLPLVIKWHILRSGYQIKPLTSTHILRTLWRLQLLHFFSIESNCFFLTEIHEVHDEAIKQQFYIIELYLFYFDIPSLLVYSQVSPRVYLCRVPFMLSALCV